MPTYNSLTTRADALPLIPEQDARDIMQGVTQRSVALQLMRNVPMSSKLQRMAVLSALPTAYFVDGDTGLKQTTELAWGNKYLTAEEIAVIVPIPEAVLDDSDYDLWAEARPLIEEAFATALDGAVLFGLNKPASWAASVLDHAVAAGNEYVRGSNAPDDLAEDINQVMALVEDDGFAIDGFAAKSGMKASFRGLRDTNGGLLYSPSLQAGTPGMLYGERIEYVRNLDAWDSAEADLLTGQWQNGIIGIRQDLTWKLLDQAVITDNAGNIIHNLAQQDMVAMRIVARYGWQVSNPISRANSGAEAERSPFGVLRPTGYTP